MINNFSINMNKKKIKNYNISITYSILCFPCVISKSKFRWDEKICRLVSKFAFCTKLSLLQYVSSFYTLYSTFEKDISRVHYMILQILQMSEKNVRRNLMRHSLQKKEKKTKSQAFQMQDICVIFRNFVYVSSCNT